MFWDVSWTVLLFYVCCFVHTSYASHPVTCKPAAYYGDHMVLQREPHGAVLWGYTNPGFLVKVTFKGVSYTSKGVPGAFGPDIGVWRVVLPPQPAGGPETIGITCTDGLPGNTVTIQLQDVLFGDVWMCSGQSNMSLTVKQAFNATAELAASTNYPDVRVLSVQHEESDTPYYDVQALYHSWAKPNPDSLGARATEPWLYFSAVCWFYGRDLYNTYKVPMGMISNNWGGTPIQTWSAPNVIEACTSKSNMSKTSFNIMKEKYRAPLFPVDDSVLWNAMIHPFLNMTIKGAIWYQGEANTEAPDSYSCLFRNMIADWRHRWYLSSAETTDPYFPFGFVQLCTSTSPQIGNIGPYPITRWHQTDDMGYVPNSGLPNVFMAVSLDLIDLQSPWDPNHPRFKQDVAARLALAARAVAYHEKGIVYQGPFPTKFTLDSSAGTIAVQYNNEGSGPIKIKGSKSRTFEVCCSSKTSCQEDDVWIGAEVIGATDKYTLKMTYSCLGLKPVALRYLWRDLACMYKSCTVYNEDDILPAPPFMLPLTF